ncbi:MAG: ABC transporter substrate-binding protein [Proteobacteria bacterium]|nr:ABC transporter substrate-binding protein [Pseudomonadota bacterium]
MKKKMNITGIILLIWLIGSAPGAKARTIVDMAGRHVIVPEVIRSVYGSSPPATNLIYAVDPGRIAGLNFPLNGKDDRFLDSRLKDLPVAGGWFGQGRTPNMETLLSIRPDIVLVWRHTLSMKDKDMEAALKPLGVPLVFIVMDQLDDYPAVFRFMGHLLGDAERAEALALYAEQTLSRMKTLRDSIPEKDRVSVYYAENNDGLSTECTDSIHSELIPVCGGDNVHLCQAASTYGMQKISMEQVLLYNPQVIVTHALEFYRHVFSDKRWRGIRAVNDHRVYLIPRTPMNWFDRPPSFMRLLGARWLAHALYPRRYPFDQDEETRDFYSLFLNRPLSDQDLKDIFKP